MPKKKISEKSKKRFAKKAPLAVGSRNGSSASGAPNAKLARIEQDLSAAIDEAIGTLKKLRDRVDELASERTAPEPQGLLAMAVPPREGPSTKDTD
jgi:hypothetical protein